MFYLASSSPRRADLLTQFGVVFQTVPNLLTQETLPHSGTKKQVVSQLKKLAFQKAFASKQQYEGLILGVDTIVVFNRFLLGKPASLSEAKRVLSRLSGKTHQVISSFCLLDTVNRLKWLRTDTTSVTFKHLSNSDIDAYCTAENVLDKAGSYGIQDVKDSFIQSVQGSYFNGVGLPIHPLLSILKKWYPQLIKEL